MISLRIPKQHNTGFEILLGLKDDSRQELLAALKLITPTLRKRNLIMQFVGKTATIPRTDLKKMVATTLSIYNLSERHNVSAHEIAEALTEAVADKKNESKPDSWEPAEFASFLEQLLTNIETPLDMEDCESWLEEKPLFHNGLRQPNNGADFDSIQHDPLKDYFANPSSELIDTTEHTVQYLLAQGLKLDDIIMPGATKGMITYISPDFDDPLDEFEEYM